MSQLILSSTQQYVRFRALRQVHSFEVALDTRTLVLNASEKYSSFYSLTLLDAHNYNLVNNRIV